MGRTRRVCLLPQDAHSRRVRRQRQYNQVGVQPVDTVPPPQLSRRADVRCDLVLAFSRDGCGREDQSEPPAKQKREHPPMWRSKKRENEVGGISVGGKGRENVRSPPPKNGTHARTHNDWRRYVQEVGGLCGKKGGKNAPGREARNLHAASVWSLWRRKKAILGTRRSMNSVPGVIAFESNPSTATVGSSKDGSDDARFSVRGSVRASVRVSVASSVSA